ncbi:MAG TPA: redoxin domain-containing protein, partial [Ferruginibacter sp.]|nr:redoxin domain-containing protein [Ferruginibacter sp.]
MKTILTLTVTLLYVHCLAQYQVNLRTNYKSGIAYLTYHMGSNYNVEDSAAINSQGVAVFKGKKNLPGGIYAIVFPGKKFTADFLVGREQVINIIADTMDLTNMQVTGSKENILFQQYQKVVAAKGALLQKEKAAYLSSKSASDSALHERNYNKYNKELNDYRNSIITNQPASMMAVLLNGMKDPPYPTRVAVTKQDSIDNYNFYKSHYWDGITFMDERIIRSPFFLPKLERYYRQVMPQAPDSIIPDADYKLLLARTSPEMFKFLLNWLTDEYLNPKYMGQDAVFVHLFNKYHSKGLSPWLNEKQMETISRRAYMQMANLVGERAANLEMLDMSGKPAPLYEVNSDYTVVVFWDPTCGHCKEEMPRVDSIFRASWKKKNVKIYAVLTEDQKPEWIKYINDHNLTGW